jgi:surface polysaccharide O-acyltransferase-like enzyme
MENIDTNYKNGISLLRIIAMLMVLLLHFLGAGGILESSEGVNYYCAWFIESFSYIAVNLFAIISGYCLYKKSFNHYKIISTWMIVFFYSVTITLLFKIIPFFDRFYTVKSIDFVKALIPISSYQYWYFTASVLLFLFAPLLNSAIHKSQINFYF